MCWTSITFYNKSATIKCFFSVSISRFFSFVLLLWCFIHSMHCWHSLEWICIYTYKGQQTFALFSFTIFSIGTRVILPSHDVWRSIPSPSILGKSLWCISEAIWVWAFLGGKLKLFIEFLPSTWMYFSFSLSFFLCFPKKSFP